MTEALFLISLVAVVLANVMFFLYAYRQKARQFNIGTVLLLIGTLLNGLMLLAIGIIKGQHPVTSTYESFNFLALLLLIIYFIAEYKFKIRSLSTFLPAIALFLMILSVIIPHSEFKIGKVFSVALLSTHITFALLGEVCFTLAFVAALLYLAQERNLKKKKFKGTFFRLPSLARLERTANTSLLFGYPFLTLGLLLGFIQGVLTLGEGWIFDAKIIFTIITWLAYSVLFMLRISGKLRGRTFILWLVIAFILVIICYALANYFSDFHYFIYSGGMNK